MSTLYQYLYSFFIKEQAEAKLTEEIIHTTATPARNMPNVPKSQIVIFSPADREAILTRKASLRHIIPEERKTEYPPNSPLILQLLEVTKARKIE